MITASDWRCEGSKMYLSCNLGYYIHVVILGNPLNSYNTSLHLQGVCRAACKFLKTPNTVELTFYPAGEVTLYAASCYSNGQKLLISGILGSAVNLYILPIQPPPSQEFEPPSPKPPNLALPPKAFAILL